MFTTAIIGIGVMVVLIAAVVGFVDAYPLPPVRPAIVRIEGLSQNSVYAICRDSRGYYWFGSADGLNRYDGYAVETYRHHAWDSTSISNSTIRAIGEDPAGNVWVGCDIGVNRLGRSASAFKRYLDGVHGEQICMVGFGAGGGGEWYVVGTQGVYWHWAEHDTLVPVEGFRFSKSETIREALMMPGGALWLATDRGIIRLLCSKEVPRNVRAERFVGGRELSSICPAANGGVYALEEGRGIFSIDSTGAARELVRLGDIGVIRRDLSGLLWAGMRNQGIRVFDTTGALVNTIPSNARGVYGLPSPVVRALAFDSTGLVFVGTDGGGVVKLDPHLNRFAVLRHDPDDPNTISGNFIKALYEDRDGNFWVGTARDGVSRYERRTGRWRSYVVDPESPRSNTVWSVAQDGNGEIWIVTESSLRKLDPVTGRSQVVHHPLIDEFPLGVIQVYALYADSGGTVWLLTNAGLEEYSPVTRTIRIHRIEAKGRPVGYCALEIRMPDGTKRLALGSQLGGLYLINTADDSFIKFANVPGNRGSLSNNTVKSICQTKDGVLWAGTEDGLNRIDLVTGEIRQFTEEDGFANNYVYGVLADASGAVWASTNFGLVQYNPVNGAVRNFDLDDGLQAMEFNTGAYCADRDGHFCFGGINGVNIFDPLQLTANPFPPEVRLTAIRGERGLLAAEDELAGGPSVRLGWNDRTFEIEYHALEYSGPLKARYKYRMDGIDPGWVDAGPARSARYTTLAPGEYRFHLVAANGDGVWNDRGAVIRIVVVPPFWRTAWFIALAAVLLLAAVAFSVRLATLRAVRRRIEEAEHRSALERERTRIARDMHDEVGAGLTRIALLSDGIRRQQGIPDSANRQLERISGSARDVIGTMSEIIWALNPVNDTLDNLAAYLRQHVAETCDIAGLRCVLEIPEISPAIRVSSEFRRNVFLAVKEALHNVVKHAGASEIRLVVALEPAERVSVSLCDNGGGFDSSAGSRFGNGLRNMARRIEELHGVFGVESVPGRGTTVRMEIPITTFM